MCEINKIKLQPTTILNVPLQTYNQTFTFVVNGKEFKTNRLISDLLSPIISQIHLNDPTFDTFTINTRYNGKFHHIFSLLDFKETIFPLKEIPFISEVIRALGNEHIEISSTIEEISADNVFYLIEQHEKYDQFYSKSLSNEIDFISKNFSQFCENSIEAFKKLNVETILAIISNKNLQLADEDQLINFINNLYSIDSKYSPLYEKVQFVNLSKKAMKKFVEVCDFNDITGETWINLTEILIKDNDKTQTKLNEEGITFSIEETKVLSGIISYLVKKSENEINITSSSHFLNNDLYQPRNVVSKDNDKCFLSENAPDSWICFDFKEHKVHPTQYVIMSPSSDLTNHFLRNWVIEGSNDNKTWEIIDRQRNCDYLNGSSFISTFTIDDQNFTEFRFIRLRQNGPNVYSQDFLAIKNFEIYGKLI